MDTRPISAVMAIAAYQLPVARNYVAGDGFAQLTPPARQDSVEISAEARRRAAQEADQFHLWGEVRYDPPHTDDPDLPWEVQHQEWMDLISKVFGKGDEEPGAD